MHRICVFDEIRGEKILLNHWRPGTKRNLLHKTAAKRHNAWHVGPLTVVVQYQLVEVPATGFLPHVLVNHVTAQLVQSDAIRQWLTAMATGHN